MYPDVCAMQSLLVWGCQEGEFNFILWKYFFYYCEEVVTVAMNFVRFFFFTLKYKFYLLPFIYILIIVFSLHLLSCKLKIM